MDATIAVSLITALATLSGGLIAGVISLKVQQRQIEAQHKLSLLEHKEQRDTGRRQVRREAYVQLLTQCDEVIRRFDKCWETRPTATEDSPGRSEYVEAESGRHEFEVALNTVYLEGPQNVSDAAKELGLALALESLAIAQCFADNIGKTDPLFKFRPDDVGSQKYDAKRKFIAEAKKVLSE